MNKSEKPRQERQVEGIPEVLEKNAGKLEAFYSSLGFGIPVRDMLHSLSIYSIEPKNRLGAAFAARSGKLEVPLDPSARSDHVRLHELGHASAHLKLLPPRVFKDVKTGRARQREVTRLGLQTNYRLRKPWGGEEKHLIFFKSLDEAINDEIAIRAGKEGRSILTHVFLKTLYARMHERFFFSHVRNNLAYAQKRTKNEVFRDFVEVYQFGWTPQLKQGLLSTFGPLALKVLAVIDVNELNDDTSLYKYPFAKDAYCFFNLRKSAEEREAAGRRILEISRDIVGHKSQPTMRRGQE